MFDVGPLWLAAAGRSPAPPRALGDPSSFSACFVCLHPISVAHFAVSDYPFFFLSVLIDVILKFYL